jgi:hypothetical protein
MSDSTLFELPLSEPQSPHVRQEEIKGPVICGTEEGRPTKPPPGFGISSVSVPFRILPNLRVKNRNFGKLIEAGVLTNRS